jgi:hypothetical protein
MALLILFLNGALGKQLKPSLSSITQSQPLTLQLFCGEFSPIRSVAHRGDIGASKMKYGIFNKYFKP